MKSEETDIQQRLPYECPHVRRIELAAEEVLAVGCKVVPSRMRNYGQLNCGEGARCALRGS